jgi:enoyl-CoA hydratase
VLSSSVTAVKASLAPDVARSRLERVGSVHVLTLDDDAKRNAIGYELAAELVAHTETLACAGTEARALVITGAGSAFCAGADLPQVFGEERTTAAMHASLRSYYECFLRVRALPIPTFAAVNGAAVGAGLNLALSCRIRIAGPRARFGATFTKIGLHPGGGCTAFLVEAMGQQRALRMLLRGATLDAAEAVAEGLALTVAEDPVETALEMAADAAELEPWLSRAVVRSVAVATTSPFDAAVELESWAQAESTHNPRFRHWIERFGQDA